MFLFIWACMWTSAFFPAAGMAALQTATAAMSAQSHASALNVSPARLIDQAALRVPAPIERAEMMTLGWVSEDDAPIF